MNAAWPSCPLCGHPIYLDIDEPHVLVCILRYGVFVRFAGAAEVWWSARLPAAR